MKRISLAIPIFIIFLVVFNLIIPVKGQNEPSKPGILTVISTDNSGILIEFNAPTLKIIDRSANGQPCKDIQLGNDAQFLDKQQNGFLNASLLLGVPVNTSYQIEILDQHEETIPTTAGLCPTLISPVSDPATRLTDSLPAPNPAAPSEFSGEPVVSIPQQGFIRYQPVIQLQVSPVQIDPLNAEIRITRQMRVKVAFNNPKHALSGASSSLVQDNGFEPVLQTNLTNYLDARQWQTLPSTKPNLALIPSDERDFYKVAVNSKGMYQITYAALISAGLPLATIDARNLHVLKENTEVPVFVSGEADGSLNPGDYLLFYAEPTATKYTDYDIYRLFWDDIPGIRIPLVNAPLPSENPPPTALSHWKTSHLETDTNYQNFYPSGAQNDHWYMKYLSSIGSFVTTSFTITVDNLANTSEGQSQLTGLLKGYAALPKHHSKIYLNNNLVYDALWNAQDELPIDTQFPSNYLLNGTNTIKVDIPADQGITRDAIFINWFKLGYLSTFQAINNRLIFQGDPGSWSYEVKNYSNSNIEIYDITDPASPIQIQGGTVRQEGSSYSVSFSQTVDSEKLYLVQTISQRAAPSSITIARNETQIRSTSHGADYIIITPDTFLTAAQSLASYRAEQGLRTQVIPIQEIYDQFSFGLPKPEAIQAFLAFAFQNWQPPAPLYVVLMGDGHLDYKNIYLRNETNFIPPLLADVDPWIGETAVDNRLAAVNGTDILPDLYIGRLPVKTLTEANAIFNKIKLYERQPAAAWSQQTVFAADNADEGGNFAASNNGLSGLLPPGYTVNKVYFNPPGNTAAGFKSAIISNLNAGRGLLVYSGHGSTQFWADEVLFQRKDVASFAAFSMDPLNPSLLVPFPFWVSLTCMDGYFIVPSTATSDSSSMAESVVRAADRGAIAAFSPTGWGLIDGHDILATGLFEAIFKYGINRAGAATTYAKYYLAAHSAGHRELIDTYTLFGDPALQLKLGPQTPPNQADLAVQLSLPNGPGKPGEWIDVQLDYSNQGGVPAEGVTISLPVPAKLLDATVTSAPLLAQHTGTPFTFLLTTLNPGQSGQVTLHARIDPGSAYQFPLQASIASTNADANTANNLATILVSSDLGTAPPTDLNVQISRLSSGLLSPGDWVDVRIDYANPGADADGVSLVLPLPAQFIESDFTLPTGWVKQPGPALAWSTPTLPSGAQGAITGRVRLATTAAGEFNLTATIASYTPDTHPDDNSASLVIHSQYRLLIPIVIHTWNIYWLPTIVFTP